MVNDLGAYSYNIKIFQALTPNEQVQRLTFSTRTLANVYQNPDYLSRWWWSDECHDVQLDGHVNKQNMRFLGWEKPEECIQQPLHSDRVTVWCVISANDIIGPYFIDDNNGIPVNVNSMIYREQVIDRFNGDLHTFCEIHELDVNDQIFQEDGATAHTGKGNLLYLQQMFPDRLVSRYSDFPYPPRSPDLTLPDAFLWGILKEQCFRAPIPRTIQLKLNIERIIGGISNQAMVRNIQDLLELC